MYQNKKADHVAYAKEQLAAVGKKLNIPAKDQYVEVGNPKEIIPQFLKNMRKKLLKDLSFDNC